MVAPAAEALRKAKHLSRVYSVYMCLQCIPDSIHKYVQNFKTRMSAFYIQEERIS